jgi:hypothetical protein
VFLCSNYITFYSIKCHTFFLSITQVKYGNKRFILYQFTLTIYLLIFYLRQYTEKNEILILTNIKFYGNLRQYTKKNEILILTNIKFYGNLREYNSYLIERILIYFLASKPFILVFYLSNG